MQIKVKPKFHWSAGWHNSSDELVDMICEVASCFVALFWEELQWGGGGKLWPTSTSSSSWSWQLVFVFKSKLKNRLFTLCFYDRLSVFTNFWNAFPIRCQI